MLKSGPQGVLKCKDFYLFHKKVKVPGTTMGQNTLPGILRSDGRLHKWIGYNRFEKKPMEIPKGFEISNNLPKERIQRRYCGNRVLLSEMKSNRGIHKGFKTFLTHWNGGNPFLVAKKGHLIRIYEFPEDTHHPDVGPYKHHYTRLVKEFTAEKTFIGKDSENDRRRESERNRFIRNKKIIGKQLSDLQSRFLLDGDRMDQEAKRKLNELNERYVIINAMLSNREKFSNQDGNSMLFRVRGNKYIFVGDIIYAFETSDKILKYFSPIEGSDVPYPVAVGTENTYLLLEGEYLRNKDIPDNIPDEDLYVYYYENREKNQSKAKEIKEISWRHV